MYAVLNIVIDKLGVISCNQLYILGNIFILREFNFQYILSVANII